MEPAISVNPYFQFEATVPEAGEFTFESTTMTDQFTRKRQ